MTQFSTKLSLIIISFLMIPGFFTQQVAAGGYYNTVNIPTAGQLSTVLTQQQKDTITSLKLTGFMNSSAYWDGDFFTLRSMPNLQYLDISEVAMDNNAIPNDAFRGKTILKKVVLPNNITTIGSYAFYNCTELSDVNIPTALTSIASYGFRNCTALTDKITFPSTLTTISNSAFYDCTALTEIAFTAGDELNIGSNAFINNTSLTKITFAEGLKTIGGSAFRNCTALKDKITFPSTLTTISDNAFYNCISLTGELSLPDALTSIGDYAFYNCNFNACKIEAETPPTANNSDFLGRTQTVYVPNNLVDAYKIAPYWNAKNIVGTTPAEYTANVITPGTLGDILLAQIDYLRNINVLTITGTLNSLDFYYIRSGLVNVIKMDMSGCTNQELPDNTFDEHTALLEIKLPSQLKKIGAYCFRNCYALAPPELPGTLEEIGSYGFNACFNFIDVTLPNSITSVGSQGFESCRNMRSIVLSENLKAISSNTFSSCHALKEIIIPNSVQSIGSRTFYGCSALKEIIIPNSVQSIGSYAFYNCSALETVIISGQISTIQPYTFENCISLKNIELPKAVTYIGEQAFYNCTSLTNLQLPEKLTTIRYQAFYNCYKLESITLPVGLTDIGKGNSGNYGAFAFCTGLKEVICLQPTPPVLSGDQFYNLNKSGCELIVPFWAEISYKLADYWNLFSSIKTHNEELAFLPVTGPLVFVQNVRPTGNPEVKVESTGALTIRGNTPFHTNAFTVKHNMKYSSMSSFVYSQLISECNSMTTDSSVIVMSMYGSRWYFLTFPFDVAMHDISIDTDAQYVFRAYDGVSRATLGTGNSWKNVSTGDTLKAGTGYIFQCSKSVDNLILPATGNSKNDLFISSERTVELQEYPSENAPNKDWNLFGNPFPSYFDVRCMNYTAPITVWNGSSYAALSPVDDEYLLKPMEAFFVQKPNDLSAIVFNTVGRQTTSEIQQRSSLRNNSGTSRTLLNLTLSNTEFSDKSRVVINPDATTAYETDRDAAKFMSMETSVPQLYSIDNKSVTYAINERPMADGIVPLGYYAGTAGEYTIALAAAVDDFEVKLLDKAEGATINLNAESYTFNSAAGSFDERFELRLIKTTTGIDATGAIASDVYVNDGQICINANTGSDIGIYSLNGVKIMQFRNAEILTAAPMQEQGVYIVKVGNDVFKVVVH